MKLSYTKIWSRFPMNHWNHHKNLGTLKPATLSPLPPFQHLCNVATSWKRSLPVVASRSCHTNVFLIGDFFRRFFCGCNNFQILEKTTSRICGFFGFLFGDTHINSYSMDAEMPRTVLFITSILHWKCRVPDSRFKVAATELIQDSANKSKMIREQNSSSTMQFYPSNHRIYKGCITVLAFSFLSSPPPSGWYRFIITPVYWKIYFVFSICFFPFVQW